MDSKDKTEGEHKQFSDRAKEDYEKADNSSFFRSKGESDTRNHAEHETQRESLPLEGYTFASDAAPFQGSMGLVRKATDSSKRTVAVKSVKLSGRSEERKDLLLRLRREASSLEELNHENIVKFYELIEQNDEVYVVLEYVEQPKHKLNVLSELSSKELVEKILLPTADALAFAHSKGIIHRDVSVGNLLVSKDSLCPKLSDFELSKTLANSGEEITKSNVGFGTEGYTSPEQQKNAKEVTSQTDVFSFGVLCYRLLTGEMPFDGNQDEDYFWAKVNGPKGRNKTKSDSLLGLVFSMMNFSPRQRPSMEKVVEELGDYLSGEAIEFRLQNRAELQLIKIRHSKVRKVVLASITLIACIALGSFFYVSHHRDKQRAEQIQQADLRLETLLTDANNELQKGYGSLQEREAFLKAKLIEIDADAYLASSKLQRRLGQFYVELAKIYSEGDSNRGEPEKALEYLATAERVFSQLRSENPNSKRFKRDHSIALHAKATAYSRMSKKDIAMKTLKLAHSVRLSANDTTDPNWYLELANTENSFASQLLANANDESEVMMSYEHIQKAMEYQKMAKGFGASKKLLIEDPDLAIEVSKLLKVRYLRRIRLYKEAFEAALGVYESRKRRYQEDPTPRNARLFVSSCSAVTRSAPSTIGFKYSNEAIQLVSKLKYSPNDLQSFKDLAICYRDRATARGNGPADVANSLKDIDISLDYARSGKNDRLLSEIMGVRGLLLAKQGKVKEAVSDFVEALRLSESLESQNNETAAQQAKMHLLLGKSYCKPFGHDVSKARFHFKRNVETCEMIFESEPKNEGAQNALVLGLCNYGDFLANSVFYEGYGDPENEVKLALQQFERASDLALETAHKRRASQGESKCKTTLSEIREGE